MTIPSIRKYRHLQKEKRIISEYMKGEFYSFNFLLGLKLIYLTAGILSSTPLSNDLLKLTRL